MKSWWQYHNAGISAFVSGLCLEGMLSCLGNGQYGFALMELILSVANLWFYFGLRENQDTYA